MFSPLRIICHFSRSFVPPYPLHKSKCIHQREPFKVVQPYEFEIGEHLNGAYGVKTENNIQGFM